MVFLDVPVTLGKGKEIKGKGASFYPKKRKARDTFPDVVTIFWTIQGCLLPGPRDPPNLKAVPVLGLIPVSWVLVAVVVLSGFILLTGPGSNQGLPNGLGGSLLFRQ